MPPLPPLRPFRPFPHFPLPFLLPPFGNHDLHVCESGPWKAGGLHADKATMSGAAPCPNGQSRWKCGPRRTNNHPSLALCDACRLLCHLYLIFRSFRFYLLRVPLLLQQSSSRRPRRCLRQCAAFLAPRMSKTYVSSHSSAASSASGAPTAPIALAFGACETSSATQSVIS